LKRIRANVSSVAPRQRSMDTNLLRLSNKWQQDARTIDKY
jgi:hypothetical protein